MTFANFGVPPRPVVMALFAVTGFSALCLQVVWQRVISIHGGVDLFSSATVVAAFMAGLGLGNLLGGALADRLGPNSSILAFAAANLGIGLFGWVSIAIFYDGYRALVQHIAVAAGRLRVPFRAARRADDAHGAFAAAAVARRRTRRSARPRPS